MNFEGKIRTIRIHAWGPSKAKQNVEETRSCAFPLAPLQLEHHCSYRNGIPEFSPIFTSAPVFTFTFTFARGVRS